MATNTFEPYFDSINDPPDLAEELFKTFSTSRDINELEATGLACAAGGKYEEALSIFDRVLEQTQPRQPELRFDWITALEERCKKLLPLSKKNILKS
ncbi:hypothetical protein BH11CYA1_BH11CYA1_10580 [soil metagenome]